MDIYKPLDSFSKYNKVKTKKVLSSKVEKPVFSIIIPTYKRAELLEVAIKSAVSQKFNLPYEIVIVNNDPEAGNDDTLSLISSFNDNRISYYVNEINIGMCGNWNRAIEFSNADYIVMLHDDNVLGPYSLAAIHRLLCHDPEIHMVGLGCEDFYSDMLPKFDRIDKINYSLLTNAMMFFNDNLSIPGFCFKKDFAMKIGGFPDEYYPNEDTIFIYQGTLYGKVVKIKEILVGYGRGDNVTIKGDTLEKIVLTTHKMRKNIAQYDTFAQVWMKLFGCEFLQEYMYGAELVWGIKLDKKKLLNKAGFNFPNGIASKFRYKCMMIIIRIIKRFLKKRIHTIDF